MPNRSVKKINRTSQNPPDRQSPDAATPPALDLSPDSVRAFGFDLSEDQLFARVRQAVGSVEPVSGPADVPGVVGAPGQRLGAYELIRAVGAGGMGAVWKAHRVDGTFERTCAIKLIKYGLDSGEMLRRFSFERQVLARLEHPHIARLYEGGTTEAGQPYLVMEYVDGLPLGTYCAQHGLDVDGRLRLMQRICSAVHYAHSNLVLHRDIKPSNILVTLDGVPKLLDFGIAKLLDVDGDERATSMTQTGQRVLTPRYASPEQLAGERLTTTSDTYALGVVLYELITGCSPYGSTEGPPVALERAVLDERPPTASSAAGRRLDLTPSDRRAMRRRLRGDLDTILEKALHKEPTERYASAEQLGEDLRRHLEGLPLLTRPPGWMARGVRLVRRRRGVVAAALLGSVVSLALAAFIVTQQFMVPGWIADHVRAARLTLLNPSMAIQVQNLMIFSPHRQLDSDLLVAVEVDTLATALQHYGAALDLGADDTVQIERDAAALALAIGRGVDDPAALARLRPHAPATCTAAEAWMASGATLPPPMLDLDMLDDIDLRCLGLVSSWCGNAALALEAWTRLPLTAPDPLIEAYLATLWLTLDQPERAYPRALSAYRAFPDAQFLAAQAADAAVRCGDAYQARALLDRAAALVDKRDRYDPLNRIEMLYHLEQGDDARAWDVYANARLDPRNPVATYQLARILVRREQPEDAMRLLAHRLADNVELHRLGQFYADLVESWWMGLDGRTRRAAIHAALTHPAAPDDAISRLRRYAEVNAVLETTPVHPLAAAIWGGTAAAHDAVRADLLETCSTLRFDDDAFWWTVLHTPYAQRHLELDVPVDSGPTPVVVPRAPDGWTVEAILNNPAHLAPAHLTAWVDARGCFAAWHDGAATVVRHWTDGAVSTLLSTRWPGEPHDHQDWGTWGLRVNYELTCNLGSFRRAVGYWNNTAHPGRDSWTFSFAENTAGYAQHLRGARYYLLGAGEDPPGGPASSPRTVYVAAPDDANVAHPGAGALDDAGLFGADFVFAWTMADARTGDALYALAGATGTWTRLTMPADGVRYGDVAVCPDMGTYAAGAWLVDGNSNRLIHLTPDGTMRHIATEFENVASLTCNRTEPALYVSDRQAVYRVTFDDR